MLAGRWRREIMPHRSASHPLIGPGGRRYGDPEEENEPWPRLSSAWSLLPLPSRPRARRLWQPNRPPPIRPASSRSRPMLPESPRGVGPTIERRAAWEAVARLPDSKTSSDGPSSSWQPIPELTDDLYLDFSRTGNRTAASECFRSGTPGCRAGAGRVHREPRPVPAGHRGVDPRHLLREDLGLCRPTTATCANFQGEIIEIDLAWSTSRGTWPRPTTGWATGSAPRPGGSIRSELQRRTFTPFDGMVAEGKPRMWWLTGTNNWNAVCLAGVTGAALAAIDSPERRAFFVAAAEKYIRYFLSGFTPDGYCSEGHRLLELRLRPLRDAGRDGPPGDRRQARPVGRSRRSAQIALFGRAHGDHPGRLSGVCRLPVGHAARRATDGLREPALRLGLATSRNAGLLLGVGASSSGLFEFGAVRFRQLGQRSRRRPSPGLGPRRRATGSPTPASSSAGRRRARPRPGRRAEGRAQRRAPQPQRRRLVPGRPSAGRRPWSTRAPRSTRPAPSAPTATTATCSTPSAIPCRGWPASCSRPAARPPPRCSRPISPTPDTLVLDLRAAYDVKALRKLERTFVFSRGGGGSLTVTDEVAFDTPQSFGTALITFSEWKRSPRPPAGGHRQRSRRGADRRRRRDLQDPRRGDQRGLPRPPAPTRLGIDLAEPATRATIRLTIVSAP